MGPRTTELGRHSADLLLHESPKLFFHHREEGLKFFLAKPEILNRTGLPVKKPVKNLIYRFLQKATLDFFQNLVIDAA